MNIKYIASTSFIPHYVPNFQTSGSSGVDLCADIEQDVDLQPGQFLLISTGLCFEIPLGYEGQVRSRSGLAAKSGIFMLNAPGTIDSDYRGIVSVVAANFSQVSFRIKPGDRIAQFVISPVLQITYEKVTDLAETARGAGGFGSTGV